MVEALGTIARSGTRAFLERIEAAKGSEQASLIGQFGIGFYSAFMVADRIDVFSRRAGTEQATLWSSDGKGTFTVAAVPLAAAPRARHPRRPPSHGGCQVLHRALHPGADRQGAVGTRAGADLGHREAGRRADRGRRRHRALDQAEEPRSPPPTTPISTAASPGTSTSRRSPSISAPRDATNTPRSPSFPARGRSTCSIPTARDASSSTSSACSSPTRPRSSRAICASCAASSIPPIFRSTSRAR